MKNKLVQISLIYLCLLVASCGGGGNGDRGDAGSGNAESSDEPSFT